MVPSSGWTWPGRRTLRTGERVWVGLIALLLGAYLTFLIAVSNWAAHPVLAAVAAICGFASVVVVVSSAWARRPDCGYVSGWRMRRLPRATRRALVRQLRAGEPGPPQLRSWTAYWTCLSLQMPWSPALFLTIAANSAASAATSGALSVWRLTMLAVVLALVAASLVSWWLHRPAVHRVADALDRLQAPSPHRPVA